VDQFTLFILTRANRLLAFIVNWFTAQNTDGTQCTWYTNRKAIFVKFVRLTNPKATSGSTIHTPNTQQTYLNISPALINKLLTITVLSWTKEAKRGH